MAVLYFPSFPLSVEWEVVLMIQVGASAGLQEMTEKQDRKIYIWTGAGGKNKHLLFGPL